MAQNEVTGGYNVNKQDKKADAWGNIAAVMRNGETVNLNGGFNPIYKEQNKLHRSLHAAAEANGGEITIDAKLTIRVATQDDGENYDF